MEDFVTFKQAKILKELGFDEKTLTVYYKTDESCVIPNPEHWNDEIWHEFSAPTLAQAQKWLRDVKRIHIVIDAVHRMNCDGTYTIFYPYTIKDWEGRILNNFGLGYECYESSLEDAIDKALELLKENQ